MKDIYRKNEFYISSSDSESSDSEGGDVSVEEVESIYDEEEGGMDDSWNLDQTN
jgi:hypothetical protein